MGDDVAGTPLAEGPFTGLGEPGSPARASRAAVTLQTLDTFMGPVLREHEFSDARYFVRGDEGSVIYCAALSDIRALRLGVNDGHVPDGQLRGIECFDVTPRVVGGLVTQIDTDGGTLDELLDERGLRDQATAARGVLNTAPEVAGPALAAGLRALFTP